MFSDELLNYDWDDTTRRIAAKTAADVETALAKENLTIEDFMALVSPAAAPYLEQMARLSRHYTQQRFGKTISMYIPLYITNSCTNSCVYCGFNRHNQFPRIILTPEQIEAECKAIRRLGPFENLLLVTGENPRLAGTDYLETALRVCRPYFNNLTMEVMPLPEEDYRRLTQSGLNGVVCFQETYHREKYKTYHPAGMKSNFEWRVNGFDRMGAAGVHKIGLGVLIGLEDWRTDVTMMARHLLYLRKHYWRTRYSVNFPRMRPSEGHFRPNVVMTDRELAQLTFAYRLFDHDVDISVSTRETPDFRNNIATLGATSMSAGSKTEPGGYETYPQALEQFAVSDERSPARVEADLRARGYEVVWKDWDKIFD
ncbi:MAG: 2-iminoacetate synthase ThiH [Muribaculaceae bacterium]|nr:2-iminoacetate synthase ThiH [Bacteroides sp.]MDE6222113.1 2-iminoacetate synthase ThiH [Muribaculaceae bacterium]MDE6818708.1 2-iminoacetate synthase ThiH [Muribaculaceae bacterium]